MFTYEFWWQLANKIRWAFGRKPQIRRCCKKEENLVLSQPRPDLTLRRCSKCGSRHFGLTVEKGQLGLKGAPL